MSFQRLLALKRHFDWLTILCLFKTDQNSKAIVKTQYFTFNGCFDEFSVQPEEKHLKVDN